MSIYHHQGPNPKLHLAGAISIQLPKLNCLFPSHFRSPQRAENCWVIPWAFRQLYRCWRLWNGRRGFICHLSFCLWNGKMICDSSVQADKCLGLAEMPIFTALQLCSLINCKWLWKYPDFAQCCRWALHRDIVTFSPLSTFCCQDYYLISPAVSAICIVVLIRKPVSVYNNYGFYYVCHSVMLLVFLTGGIRFLHRKQDSWKFCAFYYLQWCHL